MATAETKIILQHWWDSDYRQSIAIKRRNMRVSLKQYLHRVPLIEGVPSDLPRYVPTAFRLAEAYRALVKAALADKERAGQTSNWTGLAYGPLFAEMWNTACSVQIDCPAIPSAVLALRGGFRGEDDGCVGRIARFAASLPDREVEEWESLETLATANLLAEAYVKAVAELKVVSEPSAPEAAVVRHHEAILAQLISDITALALEGSDPGTVRLPSDHIHNVTATAQERARAGSKTP